jgi:hypothetical protein
MLINHCRSVALLNAAELSTKVSTERFICTEDLNMVKSLTEVRGKSFKEIRYGGLEWSYLVPVRDQWWNAGSEVVRFGFTCTLNVENFLMNLAATSRSQRFCKHVTHEMLDTICYEVCGSLWKTTASLSKAFCV